MTYDRAMQILNINTGDRKRNARLAEGILTHLSVNAPLRYKVACQVLIDNA